MFRLDILENHIQFNELITFINDWITKTNNFNYMTSDKFLQMYNDNKQNYIKTILVYLSSGNGENINTNFVYEYEHIFGNNTFKKMFGTFLFEHRNNIDFDNIDNSYTNFKHLLNQYLFDKYKFQDRRLFIYSLKFSPYTSKNLDFIIENFKDDTEFQKDKDTFWSYITEYQPLTCEFIQKYINILKTPKYAYNICKCSKNQFFQCNWNTVSTLKKIALQYENKINRG
jgi:hypothetical protein